MLENYLEEKEERMRKLNEKLNPPEKKVKPVQCPYCGKVIPEELLFSSGKVKEAIFSEGAPSTIKKMC